MSSPVPVLVAAVAAVGSNGMMLSPILADVAGAMGATPVEVARATAVYGGATALSALLLAPRIDRTGAARMLVAGLAALLVAVVGSALAGHWAALAAAQALAGVGAGVCLPAAYALATATAAPGTEARTLGRVLGGWSVSMVGCVPASAALADAFGWRAPFLALAVVVAAALAAATRLPAVAVPRAPAGPAGPLAALAVPGVPALLGVCLGYMAAFYGVYGFLGDHLRSTLGLSTAAVGLPVLAYGLGFGVAGLADGAMARRVGPGRALPVALATVAATYALLGPATAAFPATVALAGLWGFANHLAMNALILRLTATRPSARGSILGLNSAVTYLGALVGVAGAGGLYGTVGFLPVTATASALLAGAALLALAGSTGRREGIMILSPSDRAAGSSTS
jgi:predicted MFS family arabinose efflux permease